MRRSTGQLRRLACAAAAIAVALSATSCGGAGSIWVTNDTRAPVVVRECSQDPGLLLRVAPGNRVNVGPDSTPDDKGFACWIETPAGKPVGCLRMPTSSGNHGYDITAADAALAERKCMSMTAPSL